MPPFRNHEASTADEDEVLTRLRGVTVAGFAVGARQQAAMDLAKRGLVVVWEGTGRDYGLVLARRAVRVLPRPFGGGSVA